LDTAEGLLATSEGSIEGAGTLSSTLEVDETVLATEELASEDAAELSSELPQPMNALADITKTNTAQKHFFNIKITS
jgi:hypothetical protein